MPACQLLRLHPQRILTKIRQWTMGDKKKALISSKRKTLSKIMMTMTVVESYLADTCTQKHRHSSNCQPHLLSLCSCEMTNLESVILFPPTFKLPNCCPAVNTFPFFTWKENGIIYIHRHSNAAWNCHDIIFNMTHGNIGRYRRDGVLDSQ